MILTRLTDGAGNGFSQQVFKTGEAFVSSNNIPPFGEKWPVSPFVAQMATSAGLTDMRVVGTLAAPIEFFIPASEFADRYITAISFVIADDNPSLVQFGAIAALTNGCLLTYRTPDTVSKIFPPLTSNFDFVRMAHGLPSASSGNPNDVAKYGTVIGVSEAYIPVVKFLDWLVPFGLKLDHRSANKISFQIRDDTTAVDRFDAIVFGFDRFPDD